MSTDFKPHLPDDASTVVSSEVIAKACRWLGDGGVIAYPTEAVWGLGCDPLNGDAVRRILRLKGRQQSKGLILVAATMAQIRPLLDALPPGLLQDRLASLESTWPGPLTWLIPDPQGLYPGWIKGEHDSVAIRVSAHPPVQALCDAFGGPIVSTSANRAGEPPIRSLSELEAEFGNGGSDGSGNSGGGGSSEKGQVDFIFPAPLGEEKQPSQIRDLITGETLRT